MAISQTTKQSVESSAYWYVFFCFFSVMYVDWCECTVWTCVRGWAGFLSAIWNTAHAAWAVSCPQLGLLLLRLLLLLLHVPHQSLPDDVLQTQITGWIAKRVVSRVYTACKTNIYAHIGNTENQVKCLNYNKHKQKCIKWCKCWLFMVKWILLMMLWNSLDVVTAGRLKISVPGWALPVEGVRIRC